MKAILMSIRPKWVAKILNKEKTIEIRKRFPKDYVGWVYIYCTLGQGLVFDSEGKGLVNSKLFPYAKNCPEHNRLINGKVVARFWCDKVEEIRPFFHWCIEKETCLTRDEVLDYLDNKDKFVGNPKRQGKVYAIHINNLKIFDEPKEISEFSKCILTEDLSHDNIIHIHQRYRLIKAPQSYCFIDI